MKTMTTFWERNAPLMALQYVRRWALVQMNRDQSVADHSFRCWVLARDLYSVLQPVAHNSMEARACEMWALIHDADEYWTSDIPGHIKSEMKREAPGMFDRILERKFASVMPWFLDLQRGIKGQPSEYIVKICDLVESRLYLYQHYVNPVQLNACDNYIGQRIKEVLAVAQKAYPSWPWSVVMPWIEEVQAGGPALELQRLTGVE